jgi:glutaredoxin 2
MKDPILYSFKRCPYAMRARMALKLANIKCEIREIRLNNKPDHMLKVSPKGTVPILILDNKVIDESMDIINWVLNKVDVFKGNIEQDKVNLTKELVTTFDDKFKYHLDRYKYSTRYKDVNLKNKS